MKIVSWNINSVRTRLEHITTWLREHQPDVVLLQEIKVMTDLFPREPLEDLGYNIAVFGQKSYNGVAVLSKYPIEDIQEGFPEYNDPHARYLEVVTNQVRVASLYVPNGESITSEKFIYKMRFLEELTEHVKRLLLLGEKFVIGGDYNIAPYDQDIWDAAQFQNRILCSPPEQQAFRKLLSLGAVDALRIFYPDDTNLFTWWDYRSGGFSQDRGWRIDHFLLSPQAAEVAVSAGVDRTPRGWERPSDHAPLWVTLEGAQ